MYLMYMARIVAGNLCSCANFDNAVNTLTNLSSIRIEPSRKHNATPCVEILHVSMQNYEHGYTENITRLYLMLH